MVNRAIAILIGAMAGLLIATTFLRWLQPHADYRSGACLPVAQIVECARLEPARQAAPEPAPEATPVACKDWLGGDADIGRLSSCLQAARQSERRKSIERARSLPGSI